MTQELEKEGRLKEKLSKLEISFYLCIWIAVLIYACYSMYTSQNEIFNDYFLDIYNDFDYGWFWLDRKVDTADIEWINGTAMLNLMVPILFVHLVVSELLKKLNKRWLLPLWHVITGSIFVTNQISPFILPILCTPPLLFFYLAQFRRKTLIWIPSISLILLSHYLLHIGEEYVNEKENELIAHFLSIALAWTNLRCLSYFLDAVNDDKLRKFSIRNLTNVLGYCLYLPFLYLGPIVIYSDFSYGEWTSSRKKHQPFHERGKRLLKNLIRFGFWTFFTQLFLHFFYVAALPYQVDFIRELDNFSLYGFGYLMGQYFHLKYVVFYGFSTSITSFELEIPVPRIPKCVARIHLYSEMWKYFDRGLYVFLVKYIYKPSVRLIGRSFGSLLTFIFIYIWHGLHPYLLIWSALNFIGVSLEAFCTQIASTEDFKTGFWNEIGDNNKRRLSCLMASLLCVMSVLSNFYFFTGKDVGDIFVIRFVYEIPLTQLFILSIMYCAAQVSTEIQLIENKFVTQQKTLLEKTDIHCRGDCDPNQITDEQNHIQRPIRKRFRSRSSSPDGDGFYTKANKMYAKLMVLFGLSKKVEEVYKKSLLTNYSSVDLLNDVSSGEGARKPFWDLQEDEALEMEKKIDELLSVDVTRFNALKNKLIEDLEKEGKRKLELRKMKKRDIGHSQSQPLEM